MVTNMLLDFFKMLKTKDRGGKRNGIKHNMPFHALQIQLCLHVCACLMSGVVVVVLFHFLYLSL
jgi:hypothetical protein